MGRAASGFLLLAAVAVSAPAVAQGQSQDVRSLADQIDRLRRDMDVVQRQLARGGVPAAAPGAAATAPAPGDLSTSFVEQTYTRFSELENQLRELTGRVELLSHNVSELTARFDKLVGDVDFRLSALERGGAPAAGAAPAPGNAAPSAAAPSSTPPASQAQVPPGQSRMVLVPGPAGQAAAPQAGPAPAPQQSAAVTLPQGSPEAQYEFAYAQLLQAQREQGDFGRAESALKSFISANPNHRLAGNAQYWLGETYYVRRDYNNAAIAFAEGFQKYPSSEKAPDNLLKLGMSLGQLNQKAKACGTLGELERRYPQASASIKQATQREKQRLGCG
jgi:tol-pal system protein YbgF